MRKVYLPELDSLRFFAFLTVFLHHFTATFRFGLVYFSTNGWIGVDLFYVLSGYLLTRLLLEESRGSGEINYRYFFLRRILRIWPLYLGAVFVGTLISLALGSPLTWARTLGLVSFTDNLWGSVVGYNNDRLLSHLWTISFEEQFYLLLPFLVAFLVKLRLATARLVVLSILVGLLLMKLVAVGLNLPYPFIYLSPIRSDALFWGVLLGLGSFDQVLRYIPGWAKVVVVILLLWSIGLFPDRANLGFHNIYIYCLSPVAFFLLVDATLRIKSRWLKKAIGNPVFRYLGKISFGLYVFHLAVITTVTPLVFPYPVGDSFKAWLLRAAVSFLLTLIVSVASYEFYEKRFLRIKSRFTLVESRDP